MKQHFKSFIFALSLAILFLFLIGNVYSQNEEKPRNVTNYIITLRYFSLGKIKKEVVLISSSNSFSTTQRLSSKYLTFSGSISLIDKLEQDSDFLLKYAIHLKAEAISVGGIQNISGMRGLKSETSITSDTSNSCRGIVKLKNKQTITLYTLSNPVGSSKKKVEPELEFDVSISKYNSKKTKR